jgi:hypothetical protein
MLVCICRCVAAHLDLEEQLCRTVVIKISAEVEPKDT